MRLATITSVAIIGLSTAALAQVATAPAEQKTDMTGNTGGNDMTAAEAGNAVDPAPSANGANAQDAILTPQTGDPGATTSTPRKP